MVSNRLQNILRGGYLPGSCVDLLWPCTWKQDSGDVVRRKPYSAYKHGCMAFRKLVTMATTVPSFGVNIDFPFKPYDCQINYMEKMITCLQQSDNGILESPTGTGKTLCLLCSSLAWMEGKKAQIMSQRFKLAGQSEEGDEQGTILDNPYRDTIAQNLDKAVGSWNGELAAPKIIYASRTHSQLTQAIQELKRTAYRHVKVCVLGSREQMCIHPEVMKEESNTNKVHLCRAKVTARTCNFYNKVESAKNNFPKEVMDIEDLVRFGQKEKCCPYYAAREMKADADIIFMPYNYLLDPKSRRAHGVELNGNVIIFDEAHNLERICEESASFDWTSAEIATAIRELTEVSEKILKESETGQEGFDINPNSELTIGDDFTLREVLELKAQLCELEALVDKIPLISGKDGITKPGNYIFELLEQAKLTFQNKSQVVELVDKLVSFLTNDGTSSSVFHTKGSGLSKYGDVVKIVFSRDPSDEMTSVRSHQQAVSKHYKVHIQEKVPFKGKSKKSEGWGAVSEKGPSRVLSYWCFSPGHAMEDLKAHGVRSIILTSGTLSPMGSFKSEMGIKFNIELENPHVIEKHQVFVGTVGKGPDGTTLSSAYDTRFKEEYQASLGNTVVNFARVIPDGMLLFFPSYPVMDKCLENWQRNNIWNRVEQYKPIFVEPRFKAEFHTAMNNYYETVQDTKANGAVFAAVCRGKVSEGLDFSDSNGRAVMITGLPYPPRMDPRVVLKMQFLDDMRRQGGEGLTGQDWYKQQAFRAVNQAVGRVIRHKDDFGAIILCDNRFNYPSSQSQLPSWIRPCIKTYNNFGGALRDMMVFFKNAQKLLPAAKPPKKKAQSSEPGCQGAYFEPPATRTSSTAGVGPLEKASAVHMHVPSLQPKPAPQGLSMAKLKIQYEGSQSTTSSAGCRGLLDALDSKQDHGGLDMAADSDAAPSQIFSFPSSANPFKSSTNQDAFKSKKKILIKKSGGSEITKSGLQSAEVYLQQVKETLSTDSYAYFTKMLCGYKRSQDFNAMVSSLADIFTDSPANYHLFRGFYKFVRLEHKQKFDSMCRDIIGQGCGYKAEDATTKKRFHSGSKSTVDATEKKRKLANLISDKSGSMNTKEAPKLTTPGILPNMHLDSCTHLNSDQLTSLPETSKNIGGHGGACATAHPPAGQCAEAGESPGTVTSNCGKLATSVAKQEPEYSEHGAEVRTDGAGGSGDATKRNNVDVDSTGNSSPNSAASENGAKENDGDQANTAAGRQGGTGFMCTEDYQKAMKSATWPCVRCKKPACIPLKPKCEHVACMECWKLIIRDEKKCPSCGIAVKRKHLRRVFFYPQATLQPQQPGE